MKRGRGPLSAALDEKSPFLQAAPTFPHLPSLLPPIGTTVKKRDNKPKIESLVLSSTTANQDLIPYLIAVATSPRNVTFNHPNWDYLVKHQ